MKKSLVNSTACIQLTDSVKPFFIDCVIKHVYSFNENDCFLVVQPSNSKTDVFLNVNNIVSITVIKPHKYKEPKEEVFEDKAIH